MELDDVLGRLVGQHWRLLAACVVGGLVVGLFFAPHGREYNASARLLLDLPDPVARQQSEAYADTAKGIATSQSEVSSALRKADVRRGDPAAFGSKHVAVRALGSSGVIEISVTDPNRRAAAAIANALAASLIRTRLAVANGQAKQISADLTRRTAQLSKQISALEEKVNTLSVQLAAPASLTAAEALRAARDAAESQSQFLVQQRNVLQSEQVSLLSTSAQHPFPKLFSPASPPAKAESSHLAVYAALGAMLGLILGIGVAGVIETLRPTLVGGETLADELNSPLLGALDPNAESETAATIAARLRLSAEAAKVGNVALVGAGPDVDLLQLARTLSDSAEAEALHTNGFHDQDPHLRPLKIGRFEAKSPPINNGSRSGLVLVSPSVVKKTELTDIEQLLRASRLPLLGVITYDRPDGAQRRPLTRAAAK